MAENKITVGAFFGLITKAGKLRLQRRTEISSIIPGTSFQGDYELTGGKVEEKDFRKLLTQDGLIKEAVREFKEELGERISLSIPNYSCYRAVFANQDKGTEDWAFMIPVPAQWWDEAAPMRRETLDVNPKEIRELANRPKGQQLLSGWGKRMCRMALAAIFAGSPVESYCEQAEAMLTEIKPDWKETEYLENLSSALTQFRKELSLE